MEDFSHIITKIKNKIDFINQGLKVGLIFFPIVVFLIFYLFGTYQMLILITLIVIISLIIFLPYFYLKNQYENWYIQNIYPSIFDSVEDENKTVRFTNLLFTRNEINDCKVFQNIDKVDSKFSILINSKRYKIKLARLDTFNYINYKVNGNNIKEGQKLPVFEGVFINISLENFIFSNDFILISKNIPKNSSPMSNLRFKNNLYLDGVDVDIYNTNFELYSKEKSFNAIYISEIESKIDFLKIYEISQYLIISIQKNKIYLIFPGTEYFNIPNNVKFVEDEINRDINFIEKLKQCIKGCTMLKEKGDRVPHSNSNFMDLNITTFLLHDTNPIPPQKRVFE